MNWLDWVNAADSMIEWIDLVMAIFFFFGVGLMVMVFCLIAFGRHRGWHHRSKWESPPENQSPT